MKKETLVVPKGIRFLSEWKEFGLPDFPCIIDKKIPGCGFTEYCISSPENVILCSPRKLLLKNKEKQHQSEVFYVKNNYDPDKGIDKDIEKQTRSASLNLYDLIKGSSVDVEAEKKRAQELLELNQQIKDYIYYCNGNGKSIKFLVTYDSFRLVKAALEEIGWFDKFRVVIDEFQSIFVDSRFKSDTELEFLQHLQSVSKLSFVSATPMIDEYLEQLDEFKDLPYFELDWASDDPLRVLKPDLTVKTCRGINEPAYDIIQKYLEGDFDSISYKALDGTIQTIYSREAVIYVNSVTNILGIINKCGLKPEQCNVIIADTIENKKKLKRRLGKAWEIGEPPLEGQPHKMFTFCTRTVYLGADFYSTNAKTFILSDANIDTLAVDISLDLPQILGRQRNPENPWKNRAEFYYKTTRKTLGKKEFDAHMELKLDKTADLLRSYSSVDDKAKVTLAETFKRDTSNTNYKYNYVAVNEHMGSTLVPCLNKLVLLAEKRGFDIQQIDYKDRFTVFNTLNNNGLLDTSGNISQFLQEFEKMTIFSEKMRFLCESTLSESEISAVLSQIPALYKNYYQTLGPSRCKAVGYTKGELEKELELLKFDKGDIKRELDFVFKVGEVYLLSDIKDKLRTIYNTLGFTKTPKATDLSDYYKLTRKQVNKKEAFKIIKKL